MCSMRQRCYVFLPQPTQKWQNSHVVTCACGWSSSTRRNISSCFSSWVIIICRVCPCSMQTIALPKGNHRLILSATDIIMHILWWALICNAYQMILSKSCHPWPWTTLWMPATLNQSPCDGHIGCRNEGTFQKKNRLLRAEIHTRNAFPVVGH